MISFNDYIPPARFDNLPWTTVIIEESADGLAFTVIDTQAFGVQDVDPSRPASRSFTTEKDTLAQGWYRLSFEDAAGHKSVCDIIQNVANTELLCSLNDINAWLDGQIVQATNDNTALLQVSMARWVRGYLARVVDPVTLASWVSPATTPDIIRTADSMLIAAQLYFDEMSRTSIIIEDMSYSQKLYNRAIALLDDIIAGTVVITDPGTGDQLPTTPMDSLSTLDFFPIDDTDRAFSMSKKF